MKRSAFVVIALALLVFPLAAQKPSDTPRSEVQLVEATVDQLQHAHSYRYHDSAVAGERGAGIHARN